MVRFLVDISMLGDQFQGGTSKVSPEQRTRVQMSPEANNDIKMHFYDFYQINLYVFNKQMLLKLHNM